LKTIISTLTVAGMTASLLLTAVGCTQSEQDPVADNPALTAPVPDGMVRGTVLETMDSGGYTYVFFETEQGRRWAAGQQIAVQAGDVVQTDTGIAMTGFTSKSLNRTFEVVYFVSRLENLSRLNLSEEHLGATRPAGQPRVDSTAAPIIADTNVAELKQGQNIAHVYANKEALADHQFSLRGKVVKYNAGILGWNFIHIQDGSGEAVDGSNDLTVTSKATTAVGETVVVTGTIILNKDFGAGYSFPVLIEGASITTE